MKSQIVRDYKAEAESLRKDMRRMAAQHAKDIKQSREETDNLRLQLMLLKHRTQKANALVQELRRLICEANT